MEESGAFFMWFVMIYIFHILMKSPTTLSKQFSHAMGLQSPL